MAHVRVETTALGYIPSSKEFWKLVVCRGGGQPYLQSLAIVSGSRSSRILRSCIDYLDHPMYLFLLVGIRLVLPTSMKRNQVLSCFVFLYLSLSFPSATVSKCATSCPVSPFRIR